MNAKPEQEWGLLKELVGQLVEAWLENSKGDAHEQDLIAALVPALARHIEELKREARLKEAKFLHIAGDDCPNCRICKRIAELEKQP